MEGRPECACSHFGPLAEIYRKAFYIIEDFFFLFFSDILLSQFLCERAASLMQRKSLCVCACVCVCIYTPKYFCVYFHEPVQIQRVLVGWRLYYVCQWIPGFKCWRLTVQGDDLHHHLQQYAYYIRWRSAAEGPFPAFRGWGLCAHGPRRWNSVTRSSRRIKDRAQGKVDRPHTVWDKHTRPRKRELLSHTGKVNAFTPW